MANAVKAIYAPTVGKNQNGHVCNLHEKLDAMKSGLELMAHGRLESESLVTNYDFQDINLSFEDLRKKTDLFKANLVFLTKNQLNKKKVIVYLQRKWERIWDVIGGLYLALMGRNRHLLAKPAISTVMMITPPKKP